MVWLEGQGAGTSAHVCICSLVYPASRDKPTPQCPQQTAIYASAMTQQPTQSTSRGVKPSWAQ
jgi:hypothetical protein